MPATPKNEEGFSWAEARILNAFVEVGIGRSLTAYELAERSSVGIQAVKRVVGRLMVDHKTPIEPVADSDPVAWALFGPANTVGVPQKAEQRKPKANGKPTPADPTRSREKETPTVPDEDARKTVDDLVEELDLAPGTMAAEFEAIPKLWRILSKLNGRESRARVVAYLVDYFDLEREDIP